MSFDDWLRQYSRLEICNLTPDTLDDDGLKHWHSVTYPGSWVRGSSAGGCRNFPNSFWSNPQYRLCLEEEDDDPEDGEDGCTFVLGLMQKNRRKEKKLGGEMKTIGFVIYEIPEAVSVNFKSSVLVCFFCGGRERDT
uniref:calpain-2 catalytic subunit-like n=1 Tax=Myxine glutinosa TaxID=7769 RepID=UPI00358DDE6F